MRITKELASKIATVLTAKSKEAIEKLRKEIDALAIVEYQQSIPEEIKKVANSCPGWVEKTDRLNISYKFNGYLCWHDSYIDKQTIIKKAGYAKLSVNTKSPIRRRILALRELEANYRKLKNESAQVILNLATSKRVVEQFPETKSFFAENKQIPPPPAQKQNLYAIKSKLQKQ
jgi:hypothetical protein